LTDSIDYRTIGFSHNRPNPSIYKVRGNTGSFWLYLLIAYFLVYFLLYVYCLSLDCMCYFGAVRN